MYEFHKSFYFSKLQSMLYRRKYLKETELNLSYKF